MVAAPLVLRCPMPAAVNTRKTHRPSVNPVRAAFLAWYGANRACAKWNGMHHSHFSAVGALVAFRGPDFSEPGLKQLGSPGLAESRRWMARQFQALAEARKAHGPAVGREWSRLMVGTIRRERFHMEDRAYRPAW